MLERIREILKNLQVLLSSKAERAYKRRDEATNDSHAESYADGEAHAYGVASDAARESRKSQD